MKMGIKASSACREEGNSLGSRYERPSRFLGWRERHDVSPIGSVQRKRLNVACF